MSFPIFEAKIPKSNRCLAVAFIVLLAYVTGIGLLSILRSCSVHNETTKYVLKETNKSICLRNEFSDIVLVVVYSFPFYSSIPALTALYKNAFPTIMFCGPEKANNETVEVLPIREAYFSYICMSRAMEKHPGYSGYLIISDDVLLNYWNLVGLNRSRIWVGPKESISFNDVPLRRRVKWGWWKSIWGVETCQKAYSDIVANHTDKQRFMRSMAWNKINILQKNGNVQKLCCVGRGDVFYIPERFVDAFKTWSNVFYKYRTFLEIAVPSMCWMLDTPENFEYIHGVYVPGIRKELTKVVHFWKVYDKKLAFIHPLKLNYNDGGLNSILLRTWITEYSDGMSKCDRN